MHVNPLPFAYQPNISVEETLIYVLHRAHAHLDNAGATVRTIILDFTSAFNTIQPQLLDENMRKMQVDPPTTVCLSPVQYRGTTRNSPVHLIYS